MAHPRRIGISLGCWRLNVIIAEIASRRMEWQRLQHQRPEHRRTSTEVKKAPITLTPNATAKVKEIMAQQNPVPAGLRVGVVGGGCSGFSYSMQFENSAGMMDKVFDFDGLKVSWMRPQSCI